MSSKHTTWLLASNQERIFDEFASPNGQYPASAPLEAEKKLISIELGNNNPGVMANVALVYEHDYTEDPRHEGLGNDGPYVIPVFNYEIVRQLEGRLLDYVDATYADKEQRESQKRIVRRTLWDFYNKLIEQSTNQFKRAKLVESTK